MTLPTIWFAIAYLDVTYLPHRTAFPIEVARWCLHFAAAPVEIALLSVTYRELMARRARHSAT